MYTYYLNMGLKGEWYKNYIKSFYFHFVTPEVFFIMDEGIMLKFLQIKDATVTLFIIIIHTYFTINLSFYSGV